MLYIVRHGKTAYNIERRLQGQRDIPLCYEGLLQAEELGQKLKKEGRVFGALYSSRLQRARVTAEIIGWHMGLEPIGVSGLEEICLGIFEGHTFAEAAELFPFEYAAYTADIARCASHGGEVPWKVLLRARAALLSLPEVQKLLAGEETKDILVVSHGEVTAYLRAAAKGVDLAGYPELIPGNAELIPFGREELERIAVYELD